MAVRLRQGQITSRALLFAYRTGAANTSENGHDRSASWAENGNLDDLSTKLIDTYINQKAQQTTVWWAWLRFCKTIAWG